MTRVTFLFGATDRLAAAADWLGQRRHDDPPVLVISSDTEDTDTLDRLLWTRSALGFTPHCRVGSSIADDTPIILATHPEQVNGRTCLLNLSESMPAQHEQFAELIEVVSVDDNQRALARDRFRTYRNLGYPIESIDLTHGNPS